MGGTLSHSSKYQRDEYVASDGRMHFELTPIDGDTENCSFATWHEAKTLAAEHGVPDEVWPELFDHECCIDVPIELVQSVQEPFRTYIVALPEHVVLSHRLLKKIFDWLSNGELVYLCSA